MSELNASVLAAASQNCTQPSITDSQVVIPVTDSFMSDGTQMDSEAGTDESLVAKPDSSKYKGNSTGT